MEQTIRILVLITELESGGVQSVVLHYAEKLKKYNIVFDYVVQGPGDKKTELHVIDEGSTVYHVSKMDEHPLRYRKELISIIKEHPEYRIAHAHQNFLNIWSMAAAKYGGCKVCISHSHNQYEANSLSAKIVRMIIKQLFPVFVTDYWACSMNAYEWLYGRKKRNEYILHNAIDLRKYKFDTKTRELVRNKYKVNGKYIFICVGTLSKRKNQELLLKVISSINNENMILWLVGDGEEKKNLIEKTNDFHISDKVVFMGNRRDVNELLQAADCFCLPSYGEGFPVSVLEAQASGLPCLLSTNITREVAITNRVSYLSLDDRNDWERAFVAVSNSRNTSRKDCWEEIRDAGYDIEIESTKLANKYRELYTR